MTQILKDDQNIKEWYTARELAALNLPGLGDNPASVKALGYHRSWAYVTARRKGRMVRLYHYASLPQAAFEAFIQRIVTIPESESLDRVVYDQKSAMTDTAAPQWLLPLMRIIKSGARDWETAYIHLRNVLPPACAMPQPKAVQDAYSRFAGR